MLEHLTHDKSWFNKYECDQAEYTHYVVFSEKSVKDTCQKTQQHAGGNETATSQSKKKKKTASSTTAASTTVSTTTTVHPTTSTKEQSDKKPTKEDDDIDLFGSDDDEENEEAKRIREERLAMYAAKKGKKEQIIAKSAIVLDVKPWDDETNMEELEKAVRTIGTDGLIWGASKLVPVAYGVQKLQINCVVEDDKVGTDFLEERISEFEDYVQSVDIASFNKI